MQRIIKKDKYSAGINTVHVFVKMLAIPKAIVKIIF